MNATPNTLSTRPTFTAQMRRVMDHDNTRTAYVLTVRDGTIWEVARAFILWSKSGRVQVVVINYGDQWGLQSLHYGSASGYGYDKLTAALAGARIGDVVLADHGRGSMTIVDAASANGWKLCGFNS
jgi:hypothetical protein